MPDVKKQIDALFGQLAPLNPAAAVLRQESERETRLLAKLIEECRDDPCRYAREVLQVKPTSDQDAILSACTEPPYKVAVGSGQNLGKSFVGGIVVNWRYDCWGGITITTAPKKESVVDILWKEVRMLRSRNPLLPWDFIGPAAPAMRRAPDYWAKGFVATSVEAFKGRHVQNEAFLFDEAVGIPEIYFRAVKGMFISGTPRFIWLVFFNPRDPTCPLYQELHRQGADWRVFSLSSLDHPNVIDHLEGRRESVPGAVTFNQIDAQVSEMCDPLLSTEEKQPSDFVWPPVREAGKWTTRPADDHMNGHLGDGEPNETPAFWYRPSGNFESDWLGIWPTASEWQVWPNGLWVLASQPIPIDDKAAIFRSLVRDGSPLEVGCDTAGKGKDYTAIHVRWGAYSVHHEEHNGWRATQIVGRLVELCREWSETVTGHRQTNYAHADPLLPEQIRVKLDDANEGGACVSFLREQGMNAIGINAGTTEGVDTMRYPRMRDQLWFQCSRKARSGQAKFGLLSQLLLEKIRVQATVVSWKQDSAGRRCVEKKEETVDKIGRSPDSLDAINLAFLQYNWRPPEAIAVPQPTMRERMEQSREQPREPVRRRRGGIFGQGR